MLLPHLAYTRESRKLRASGVEPDFSAYETDKMTAPPSRNSMSIAHTFGGSKNHAPPLSFDRTKKLKEGVGFEPTCHLTMTNGFQDRPYKPTQATFQIIHRDIRHGFFVPLNIIGSCNSN